MKTLAEHILTLTANYSDKEVRQALSEVAQRCNLHVASNLMKQNINPVELTKGGVERFLYTKADNGMGLLPLDCILDIFENVINTDESNQSRIKLEKNPWYKSVENLDVTKVAISFEIETTQKN